MSYGVCTECKKSIDRNDPEISDLLYKGLCRGCYNKYLNTKRLCGRPGCNNYTHGDYCSYYCSTHRDNIED